MSYFCSFWFCGRVTSLSLTCPSLLQVTSGRPVLLRLTHPFFALCFSKIRDELIRMKPQSRTNGGQPFFLSSTSSSCSAPSSPSHPISVSARPGAVYPSSALTQSPAHKPQAGGVKKVTGVGGTTYEISVWAAASLQLKDQKNKETLLSRSASEGQICICHNTRKLWHIWGWVKPFSLDPTAH